MLMTMHTGRMRTISGFLADLLEYPRWVIERDVDFTHCRYDSHFNAFIEECADCRFGRACRWLDRNRSQSLADATVEELAESLEAAIAYLRAANPHDRYCDCDTCNWLREVRHFKRLHLK